MTEVFQAPPVTPGCPVKGRCRTHRCWWERNNWDERMQEYSPVSAGLNTPAWCTGTTRKALQNPIFFACIALSLRSMPCTNRRQEGRHTMKTKLLAIMLFAGGSMFAETHFAIGIGGQGAGFYQPPPSYASRIPPCPGPDYSWVDGYWSQNHGRNSWVAGYWNKQPARSGRQVAQRFDNQFNEGRDRPASARASEQNQYRANDHDRGFSGQDHNQTRSFGQDRGHGGEPNQSPNTGYANGFRNR